MTELQELKRLLVGEETDAVRQLSARLDRLEDREHRLQNVVESLPEAILASDDRLTQALGKPVRDSFRESLARDPKQYAEILYPVMAPAIRISIAQAMRDVIRTINSTVDSAFSAQSLKWRFESFRTRTPYSQIVLKNSFRYRVEEILLIHKDTGLLIDRVVVDPNVVQDGDAVGAMLAALEDFVRDSFSQNTDNDGNDLREVDVGGRTVWLSHSPTLTMATVIFGVPPEALRAKLDGLLESLHSDHGVELREFDGTESIPSVQADLSRALEDLADVQPSAVEEAVRRPSPLATLIKVLLGIVLLSGLIYLMFQSIEDRNTLADTRRILDDTPGIVVTEVEREGDFIHVTGLADPLALIDEARLKRVGVERAALVLDLEPYQSLDGPIVLQRARKQMDVPEDVETYLDNGILNVRGLVDYEWLSDAKARSNHVTGIDGIDFDGVTPRPSSIQKYLSDLTDAPPGVDFVYVAGVVRAQGYAPVEWIDEVRKLAVKDRWVRRVDWSRIESVESTRIREISSIFAAERLTIETGKQGGVATLSNSVEKLSVLAEQLFDYCETLSIQCSLNIFVTSSTGNERAELDVGQEMIRMFKRQGVAVDNVTVTPAGLFNVDPTKASMIISFGVETEPL